MNPEVRGRGAGPSSRRRFDGRGGGRGGRPQGLRGREIGMYYAQKNRAQREKGSVLHLDENQRKKIDNLLNKINEMPALERGTRFMEEYRRHLTANLGNCTIEGLSVKDERDQELDMKLKLDFEKSQENKKYQAMQMGRQRLPAHNKKDELVSMINNHQVVVISGETGCGKTTQVPQFLLDDALLKGKGSETRIVCTQPRRISAISVAERVAEERGEPVGHSVGYQIRLETRAPRKSGSVTFCTTGVVLRWMRSDRELGAISHIILDEIHERDIQSDLLMTLLRRLLESRTDLRVVLMSATLNAHQFSRYFRNCPTVEIPGFTFPVQELYLEDVLEMTGFQFPPSKLARDDRPKWHKHTKRYKEEVRVDQSYHDFIEPYLRDLKRSGRYSQSTIRQLSNPNSEEISVDLLARLVRYIHDTQKEGAILVFLTGWSEISKLHKILTLDFKSRKDVEIHPLHSLMPTVNQKAIFNKPPSGVRKIIIATNIAETSITIEDVVYVVDCGRIKMTTYDAGTNVSTLKPEWVSLANSRQRRGRAGRVKEGICYHLFTRAREMTLDQYVVPEILRTRLDQVILTIKILELGLVKPLLTQCMEPPSEQSIDRALTLLASLNALKFEDEQLTPLGFHLAQLPMDPQTGKMILMAALFSCLDPILSVAASLSFKDAFVIPLGKEDMVDRVRVQLAGDSRSDHMMFVKAIEGWEKSKTRGNERDFCWDHFLSESTLRMLNKMKEDLAGHLYESKFICSKDFRHPNSNRNKNNSNLIRAVICGGLYPNVGFIKMRRSKWKGDFGTVSTVNERKVGFHPKSVNSAAPDFRYPWVVYHLKMKSSSSTNLYDSTMVSPLALCFFGQSLRLEMDSSGREILKVDEFVKFLCHSKTSQLVKELRRSLDSFLEHKICHPGVTDWNRDTEEGALLNAVVQLLSSEVFGVDQNDYDTE